MKIQKVKLSEIKRNPDNPRLIKDNKYKKLVTSIIEFPEMLEIRPIVVNDDMVVLGGNMRLKACQEAKLREVPIIKASTLTAEQQREFIVKDNVGFGEWDWDMVANEWDAEKVQEWGLDLPIQTETEKLSGLEFQDIYYKPKKVPNINIDHCIDMDLFNKKIKFIEESNLDNDKKETLKLFAYRFLKIDFESVANYYYFNASIEEKKVIERLRLVLCDGGLEGFIQDDILRIHGLIQEWKDD